jgi:hypothetical protein
MMKTQTGGLICNLLMARSRKTKNALDADEEDDEETGDPVLAWGFSGRKAGMFRGHDDVVPRRAHSHHPIG